MIIVPKKFHDQLSTTWKTRKAGGVTEYKSKNLKARNEDGPGQEEMDVLVQIPISACFASLGSSIVSVITTHIGESHLLYLVY